MRSLCISLLVVAGCFVSTPPEQPGPSGAPGATATECRMGSDGRQACGYHCQVGADGIAACANSPDGSCAMGSDGHVYCSQVATAPPPPTRPTECKLNSDGTQSCGYNCRLGSNGYHYCASIPDGRCALNSDGTFTCP